MRRLGRLACAYVAVSCILASAASASPWAEVGDAQLRSDIEILSAAGVIDGITTHWPLPWAGILSDLRDDGRMSNQPEFVRAAAARVFAVAQSQMHFGSLRTSAWVDATNEPSVVRGFDALGRGTVQGQISAEYMASTTSIRANVGGIVDARTGRTAFMPDDSYIAQKIGGAVVYAGYLTHWWGPGWISALSLSNNARPMPQIGIARDDTSAFESPWLSWIGPWQLEFLVGWFDDRRVATNTIFDGLRFTFNPLPGLEIAIARTQEMCGEGHPCKPLAFLFGDFQNSPTHPSRTNSQGNFDVKYSKVFDGVPYEVYAQFMNEDSNPITHSITSHLVGASVWVPTGQMPLRLTVEYTDSVPTVNVISFGDVQHGSAYNDSKYIDGMRYQGRALGFSLDSDSTLLTLQGAWQDANGWTYELSFHHAAVSNPNNTLPNLVTTAPVHIDMGEARVGFPLWKAHVDLAGRLASDQPRPDHGFAAAIEAQLSYAF
jgi:hypothetical protein